MIADFVDIGGIVDHHCLNFLFMRSPLVLIDTCSTYTKLLLF